ncbi:neurotrypsin-like [Pomacea canaliculata]|uniref:neurotrypsin-like n=1 Tax=Pomacea canaliculata TaxID=400727 RepID=UPI000D729609|nr:neurotrypsin-like [Pomacea canaliculata]
MQLRLVNGTAWSGRLEVFHEGKCSGAVAVRSDLYGQGSGFIFRKHVKCSGSETSFSQCEFGSIYYCEHWMDVGVICNSPGELTPRLVNGAHWSGRLEILVNGTWSSMYELEFGNNEAQVVCRMLGLNSPGAVSVTSDMYGVGSGDIFAVPIKCTGAESKLSECKRVKLKLYDPHHCADVGVICNIPGQITPRLVEGSASSGRLEILYNGTWNLVCDEGFGLQEAEVACRMLGFDSHGEASVMSLIHGNSFTRTISGNVTCMGTERSLAECQHPGFNTIDCEKSQVIGISCSFRKNEFNMKRIKQILHTLKEL